MTRVLHIILLLFITASSTAQTGIPCNPGTFWAHDGNGTILEFTLNGTVITPTGNSYAVSASTTACYANVDPTSGSAFNPTFFDLPYIPFTSRLRQWNGTAWDTLYTNTTFSSANGGGSGDHVYFAGFTTGSPGFNRIYHYSLGVLDTIYAGTQLLRFIWVGDVCADAVGNCYFFTGNGSGQIDTLNVISPTGTVLEKFPVFFQTNCAYGSFIMGDTLYVGLCNSHPIWPNTLLPIFIGPQFAGIGQPIPFPGSGTYTDLESCNQGTPPVGIAPPPANRQPLTLFPSPTSSKVFIQLPVTLKNAQCHLTVLSSAGTEIRSREVTPTGKYLEIDLGGMVDGTYTVLLDAGDRSWVGKVVVMR